MVLDLVLDEVSLLFLAEKLLFLGVIIFADIAKRGVELNMLNKLKLHSN